MEELRSWFLKSGRELPWRESREPYAVWISEVMLQQTQVAVVIPYFERWMEKFPTVVDLARAPIEQVIKTWEGLGYYSRARNLHAAANQIVAECGGALPDEVEKLRKIRGFGPYTAGAVASFAFGKRAAAVDGNVLRVMTRYLAIEEDITKPRTRSQIEKEVLARLPPEKPWEVMEALIELGALVCKKNPLCGSCPLQDDCKAFSQNIQSQIPVKAPRIKTTKLYRDVACIFSESHVLLGRGKKGQVMQDLWEFPFSEKDCPLPVQLEMERVMDLPKVVHTFTRFRAHLFPTIWKVKKRLEIPGFTWTEISQIHTLPLSAGHKKILAELDL